MRVDVDTVRRSFRSLAPQGVKLVDTFYDRLYTHYPEIRPLFCNEQRLMLLGMLEYLVSNLDNEPVLILFLKNICEKHSQQGVNSGDYVKVGWALMESLEEVSQGQWTDRQMEAWSGACDYINYLITEKILSMSMAGI